MMESLRRMKRSFLSLFPVEVEELCHEINWNKSRPRSQKAWCVTEDSYVEKQRACRGSSQAPPL